MFRSFVRIAVLILLPTPAIAQGIDPTITPVTITFEDLLAGFNAPAPGTGYYGNAEYLVPPANAGSVYVGYFISTGTPGALGVNATFNTFYAPPSGGFGAYSSGWFYSTVYNPITPSFTNQYAAYNVGTAANPTGTGTNGATGSATYAVANNFYRGDATITLPSGYNPASVMVTNTTYAYLAMRDGDQYAFAPRPFGVADAEHDGKDWFKLTIYGVANGVTIGSKELYLADFRSDNPADHYIIDKWTMVDLSSLAGAKSLEFDLTSSDNHPIYGLNTPAYFAVDNLVLTPVPEPASILVVAVGAGLLVRLRMRRGK